MRIESAPPKKTSAQQRSDIAALKRRVAALEALVKRLAKKCSSKAIVDEPDQSEPRLRFSGAGLHSQRQRLGLSAVQMALLLGVSDQSVNKWEQGKAHPQASHLPAIAAMRKMSKSVAAETLSALAG